MTGHTQNPITVHPQELPAATQHSRARTWKCGLETHLASCRKSGSMILTNSEGSITSKISSNSFKNITSFGLWVFGQYLRSAITTWGRNSTQRVTSRGDAH